MTAGQPITELACVPPQLTPEQATQDALVSLKEAGFGKEHGRPVTVESWSLGRSNFGMSAELIRTDAKVRRAEDVDAAIRALLVLPGVVTYALKGTAMSVHRIADRDRKEEHQ